jgi:pimeloyl-ACP methyl ester carboxylesterase
MDCEEQPMTQLAYTRSGTGESLVLLHALGLSRRTWDHVVPELARHFEVVAVDLPGFGDSPPLPPDIEPSPAALAAVVAGFLDELGVIAPHVVGNSLGGWIALELATIRPVASLTLLSPAGLWRARTPRYVLASLHASRWLARYAPGVLSGVVGSRLGRAIVLGQTHGRPERLTTEYARSTIRSLGTCPGFDAVLAASAAHHAEGFTALDVAATVAFGSRDFLLLPHQSRRLDQLPPRTRVDSLPGCGHVPIGDDPDAVAALIVRSAARDLSVSSSADSAFC